MRHVFFALTFASTSLLAACSKSPAEPAPTQKLEAGGASKRTESAKPTPAEPGKSGELRWNDPAGWERRPPSNPMRVVEYKLPRAEGVSEDAECVVTTFGPGQGGSVEANIERWVRQFEPDTDSKIDKTERDVAGMHVTTIEVGGTYRGMAMPGAGAAEPKKQFRVIGAIVEAPSGMWFFKLTGPDATVKAGRSSFVSMLDSLKGGS